MDHCWDMGPGPRLMASASARSDHPALESGETPPHRPVHDSIANLDDHSAKYRGIERDVGDDALAVQARQLAGQCLSLTGRGFPRDSDVGVDAVLRCVDQRAVFRRDRRNQHLPALADEDLEEL